RHQRGVLFSQFFVGRRPLIHPSRPYVSVIADSFCPGATPNVSEMPSESGMSLVVATGSVPNLRQHFVSDHARTKVVAAENAAEAVAPAVKSTTWVRIAGCRAISA